MGKTWLDAYSLLHFAVGIVAYFWGVSMTNTLLISVLFEIVENTPSGIHFINTWIPMWPGGKGFADARINRVSDTLFVGLGHLAARILFESS